MKNAPGAAGKTPALFFPLALLTLAFAAAILATPAAAITPGGVASPMPRYEEQPTEATETPPAAETTGPPGKATLVGGQAIPPANAPAAVKAVIAAANQIRTKPYIYGGGHGRWWDAGYDCSGAVSFALHGGSLISTPMPSGSLESWGSPGRGRWITVYANGGHAYAVIAGLRWDTAGNTSGTGPRWHKSLGAAASGPFVARHPTGY